MKVTEHRDASNRLTIEMNDFPMCKYFWLKRKLKKHFKLKKQSKTVIGFYDEVFQELYNPNPDIENHNDSTSL